MYIYKITNTKNGKAYIGSTVRPIQRRMSNHWSDAKNGKQTLMAQAIREFGKESFEVEVIETLTSEDKMMVRESELITSSGTLYPGGYNLTAAPGLWGPGRSFLKSVREKISASSKGKVISPEHRKKLSESLKGRPSLNFGRKTGKPSWNRGIPITEEARAKLIASRAGKLNLQARAIEMDGVEYKCIADAARATGLHRLTIKYRLGHGAARYINVPEGGYQDQKLYGRRLSACPKCEGPFSERPDGQRYCKPCRNAKMMAAQRIRRAAAKNSPNPTGREPSGTNEKEINT